MIVVGAGIIGLSCAWRLAQKSRKLTIFDKGRAAREASWAAAGMLAPDGEFDTDSPAAQLARRSLKLYPEFVAELEEESGIVIDFQKCGAMEVSASGEPVRFFPDEALVDPRDVTRALLTACRKRGVAIHENTPAATIEGNEPEGVLIAAGAWSGGLYHGLPETTPVRGHLVAWSMNPGVLRTILRHGHTYLMQRSSGVLVAGSTTEHVGFDRTIDEAAVADVVGRARRLCPQLPDAPPDEVWNGLRPFCGDMPAIGRVEGTNVWTAYGHYRNGVLMAPETARMIAEMVTSAS